MNGGKHGPVQGMGYGLVTGEFTYFPNASADPVVASCTGGLARWISSITWSADGIQTIVFKAGFSFANLPRFSASATCVDAASSFTVYQKAQYVASTRTLVLQQVQGTTGYNAASNADCSVSVRLHAQDSTGK